ncbi:MAG: 2Fe-2S iron-sulfur cluster-binding protein [Chitinophagaceae bacterium]
MITISITDREDKTHSIEVPADIDLNLMEIAKANELPVEGTCGGMALCASCHMYITSDHELILPSDDEIIMLDQAFFVEENSRLGCQIKINETLDGLTVKLAPVAI